MTSQLQTKKIAKNTLLLYFRMILTMIVSLYTSRIVLKALGVDDFGIYNIVGGVIVMFSFINTFLTGACQRFISYSIAKDNATETTKIFYTSLFIHLIILLLFALFAETIGLYFVYHELVIPESRFSATIYVYHIMVIESCISIFKIPYNAVIISEEKMNFYAYTSIIENVLRLITVFFLLIIPFDKLIVYAYLHFFVSILMLVWYKIYTTKNFTYCKTRIRYEKKYLKKMISFSGWNLLGSIADIGYKQGTNIVLNLFYGVTLNAAMGIATTVRSSIYSFINNIQVAANPQIIKSYAIEDYKYYSHLIYRISKYSYFLMLFLAIPIIINITFILHLWLGEAPDYSASFIILGLIFCLIDSLHGPLWTSMQATGNIRTYQLILSFVLLLNVPISYVALKLGYSPNSILIIQILISCLTLILRFEFSRHFAKLNTSNYIKDVIVPILLVTAISLPLPLWVAMYYNDGWQKILITSSISMITISMSVFFVGMTHSERISIFQSILKRIKK